VEESRAGRNLADVVESTEANIAGLHKKELLQEYHSPEIRFYDGEVLAKGKRGVYYWADRELYISLGFNTNIVSGEVPLSPTMFDSNVFVVKRSGAPVEWRPIDPVVFIPKKGSSSL